MLAFAAVAALSSAKLAAHLYPLTSTRGLHVESGGAISVGQHQGKRAVAFTEVLDPNFGDVATVDGLDFHNGTIEFDVAGTLTENAGQGSRSFAGIAFRGDDGMKRYENFYLRMTNGRSRDQVLRNHAVQYCSIPEYTWDLLRQKRPFRYEAYTDLQLGAWTHVRATIHGTEARFYVGEAKQPTLIVQTLLHGDTHGKVGLWVAAHTRAYFRNLRITPT